MLMEQVQPSGDPGDEARKREGGELGAHRTDAIRLGRPTVVARRDQHASSSRAAQPPHGGDDERQEGQDDVVEGVIGLQIELVEDDGPDPQSIGDVRDKPGEVLVVQEEGAGRDGEGQRRHRQEAGHTTNARSV